MKQPSKRETTNREEMVCPHCDTEGLEENPAYMGEYSGRAAVLKATRCPNEKCDYYHGMPQSEVEMQMPEQSILDTVSAIFPSDVSKDNAVMALFIIGGGVFLMTQMGIGPLGSSSSGATGETADITGEIIYDETTVDSVEAQILNETGELFSTSDVVNGTYEFSDVEPGSYTVYAIPDSHNQMGPPGTEVTIDDNGDIQTNETLDFEMVDRDQQVINQTVGDAAVTVNYTNPANIEDIDLRLTPLDGDQVEREITVSEDEESNILVPVAPQAQELRVDAPMTTETITDNRQYTGESDTYEVYGNEEAEELLIELTEESTAPTQTVDVEVDGNTRETITVNSDRTLGPANVTVFEGTAQAQEQETGTWIGEQNITTQTGLETYTTGTIQIQPETSTTNASIPGVVQDSEITLTLDGNVPTDDAEMLFEGGDADAAVVGQDSLEADAEDGTIVKETDVATVSEGGSYRLDVDSTIEEHSDLVDFWYEVDGERTTIPEDEELISLSLSENETVSIGMEVERETVSTESVPHQSSTHPALEVTDVLFSSDEDAVTGAVVENTRHESASDEFTLYMNGERDTSVSEHISGNSEVELDFGTRMLSDEEGTHVIYINEFGPFFAEVGDAEPTYGVGEIEAEVNDVGAEGEISVDTTGDGNLDCTALASRGSCEFDRLQPGHNNIEIEEEGVSNTEYTLEYTQRDNPRDITVDVGENGLTDVDYSGVLRSTTSETIEIPPEEMTFSIESANEVPVGYSITWNADAMIDNPVIEVNSDTKVSDEGKFPGPKSFDVGELEQGENTFRFLSEEGGYTAVIEWTEGDDASYPSVNINDREACSASDFTDELVCETSNIGVNPGENTIDFQSAPSSFNYQLEYDARAVAGSVDVDVGSETVQFSRPTVTPEPWDDVDSTTILSTGDNPVTVNTSDENNITPDASATFAYSLDTGAVENPRIQVENADGETNVRELPDSAMQDGQLIAESTVSVPSEWMTTGENTIEILSDDGVVELYGEVYVGQDTVEIVTLTD